MAGIPLSAIASPTGAFVSGANPTSTSTSANFLYNTATGSLSFDPDGAGLAAAVPITTLNGVPSLGSQQFAIIA